jgi:hypothetical protein
MLERLLVRDLYDAPGGCDLDQGLSHHVHLFRAQKK